MSDVRIERMVERVLLCMSTLDPEQEKKKSQFSDCHAHVKKKIPGFSVLKATQRWVGPWNEATNPLFTQF